MLKNENLLDQYSAEKPFTILLAGENLDDGIGDFIHLYDFYKQLKEKYKNDKRVKIECISFIDDKKLEIINKIYGTQFKFTENSDDLTNDNEISFFRTKRSESESQALLEKTNQNKNCDLLFYLPAHPGNLNVTPKSHIYLAEYERGNLYSPQPTDKISDNKWEFRRSMGIAPDRAGIKIIQPIIDAKNTLTDYDNKYFEATKSKDTFLAAGYMQSKFQADIFIMNSIALAGDKNTINIVTNTDGIINTTNKELFYSKELNNYVKNMSISRIEVVSPEGEMLFDKDVENAESKKVLRIIQFKNISEHDKNLLFASADCVGASGDTSISELISSMAFPCIVKKTEFINQLKNQSKELGLTILEEYFSLLNAAAELETNSYISNCVYDKNYRGMESGLSQYNKVPAFITNNHDNIQSQWRILCAWIMVNKNVYDFTDCLIKGAMQHSANQLKPGDIDEMYNALKFDMKNKPLLFKFSFLSEETKQSVQVEDNKPHQSSITPSKSGKDSD